MHVEPLLVGSVRASQGAESPINYGLNYGSGVATLKTGGGEKDAAS